MMVYLKSIDKINGLTLKANFDRDRQMQINGNIVKAAIDSVTLINLIKQKLRGNNPVFTVAINNYRCP